MIYLSLYLQYGGNLGTEAEDVDGIFISGPGWWGWSIVVGFGWWGRGRWRDVFSTYSLPPPR